MNYLIILAAVGAVLGYQIYQRIQFEKALKEHPNVEKVEANEKFKAVYPVFIIVAIAAIVLFVMAQKNETLHTYVLLLLLVIGALGGSIVNRKANQYLYYNKDGFVSSNGYHRYRDIKKLEKNGVSYRIQYYNDKRKYSLPGRVGKLLDKVRRGEKLQ